MYLPNVFEYSFVLYIYAYGSRWKKNAQNIRIRAGTSCRVGITNRARFRTRANLGLAHLHTTAANRLVARDRANRFEHELLGRAFYATVVHKGGVGV